MRSRNSLEAEEGNFLLVLSEIFEEYPFETLSANGRPPLPEEDVLKSLCIMAFHSMSYRRCYSSLLAAKEIGIINNIPKRTCICRYMNSKKTTKVLSELIQKCALKFIDEDHTLILDSTWFGTKMYVGGYANKPSRSRNPGVPPLAKCMKLHLGVLKNRRIIAYAVVTKGTTHDSLCFREIVSNVLKAGFNVNTLLADAGYLSKDNYAFAEQNGIENVYIDFRKNSTGKRGKSKIYNDAFRLYKYDNEGWHETYRYRVIIESIYSVLKRKYMNWLRTRKITARTNEILLKALCYNITIIAKYMGLQ